jgi:hypothetical protein
MIFGMVRIVGCPIGQERINEKCEEKKQKTGCNEALEKLERYLFYENKKRSSQEFKDIMKSVLKSCSCIKPKDTTEKDIDPSIRVKSLDMVAKHAKVYSHRGTLPSGHRGDLLKVRNGHGSYVPLEDRLH